jgi:hypothetical protein
VTPFKVYAQALVAEQLISEHNNGSFFADPTIWTFNSSRAYAVGRFVSEHS